MKAILFLSLFAASYVRADEAADRAAIGRVIVSLNEIPPRIATIAASPSASAELATLTRSRQSIQIPRSPRLAISHEPWGEVTIIFAAPELHTAKIASTAIRFIMPNVALADGDWMGDDGTLLNKPMLFVLKKLGDDWKVASVRMLAPR